MGLLNFDHQLNDAELTQRACSAWCLLHTYFLGRIVLNNSKYTKDPALDTQLKAFNTLVTQVFHASTQSDKEILKSIRQQQWQHAPSRFRYYLPKSSSYTSRLELLASPLSKQTMNSTHLRRGLTEMLLKTSPQFALDMAQQNIDQINININNLIQNMKSLPRRTSSGGSMYALLGQYCIERHRRKLKQQFRVQRGLLDEAKHHLRDIQTKVKKPTGP